MSGQNNSAEISNTNIISNTAAQEGGAIFSDADSTLTLRDSRVLSNTATGNGGALYNQGEATIEQTTFANNHSDERGGAVLNDGGTLVVRDSRMEVNSASVNGGAIRLLGSVNSAEIDNTDIVSNTAGNGGGIFTDGNSTLILRQSNVSHNSVATGSGAGSGGGLTVEGAATIEQSTIAHNSAGRLGGGIYFQRFNSLSRLTLVNSTVSGNSAEIGTNDTTSGSGIGANASIAVINSSIVNNGGAGSGINMTNGGRVTLTNSIVANNAIRDCASSLSTISHSLIADGSCGISDGVNGNIVADPQLGPLADSGGPTPTHALLSNSPAIGAADQTVCDAASVNSLDQRNAPRTAPCDIGAFEFGSVPTAVGLGVQQTTDGKAAVLPLLVLVVMTGIVCVRRGEMVSAELPRQHDTT